MRRSAENQVKQLQDALAALQHSSQSAAKDRRHVASVQRRLNTAVVVRMLPPFPCAPCPVSPLTARAARSPAKLR